MKKCKKYGEKLWEATHVCKTSEQLPLNNFVNDRQGYDDLWLWFGLSRASWLTLPRTMMHEMPDKWQLKMAALLNEWDNTWENTLEAIPQVQLREDGKLIKTPEWLLNYR